MLGVQTDGTRIHVGERFSVSFQRTLRIPEDDQVYPLPPTFGPFRIHEVAEFADRLPEKWGHGGAFFVAMYQCEALWLGFGGMEWKPNAVKVAIGGVNAISGTVWERGLQSDPQNYIVCPDQPWLDGINAGDGVTKQFVAAPLGAKKTIEGQITTQEHVGGIQLVVYEPKRGKFPDVAPEKEPAPDPFLEGMHLGGQMGLGAGGSIKQKIYRDVYGLEAWDQQNFARLYLYILNSEDYRSVTGFETPPTPVSAERYAEYGLPWFELYDELMQDVPAPVNLAEVKTVGEGTADVGSPIDARRLQIRPLNLEKSNTK